MYLNKVYSWPMLFAFMNGESGDMCEKYLRDRKKGRTFLGKRKLDRDIINICLLLQDFPAL